MDEVTVLVEPDGRLRFVWNDCLRGLADQGEVSIRRASHVEPTLDGRWTADMSPVGGGLLGPFELHGQAIAAERAWLGENLSL